MAEKHLYTLLREDAPGEVIGLGESKRFVKQLVKFDNWVHPHGGGKKMRLDRQWAEKVASNFNNHVAGQVAVPLGHPKDSAELAQLNRGELTGVEIRDDGMYGTLDVRDAETAKRIEDNLLWDVSISWDPNYVDKLSGEEVGPALLHVGLLTDPYLKGMKPFEALANQSNAIMLSESKEYEVAIKVTNDREFPVVIDYKDGDTEKSVTLTPGEEVEVPEAVAEAVQTQVKDAVAPVVKEPTEEETAAEAEKVATEKAAADKVAADKAEADRVEAEKAKGGEAELDATKKELADARKEIALRDATSTYTALLTEGKIVPAQKDAFMSLSTAATTGTISLADGATTSLNDLLTDLFKGAPKRINFGEEGAAGDEAEKTPWDELSDEEKKATVAIGVTADEYNEVNGTKSTKKEA